MQQFDEWRQCQESNTFYDVCQEIPYGAYAVNEQVEIWIKRAYTAGYNQRKAEEGVMTDETGTTI